MERKDNLMSRRSFLRKSIIASAGLVVGAQAVKMLADTPKNGTLAIFNHVDCADFRGFEHFTLHYNNEPEEYRKGSEDELYSGLPPSGKFSSIISIVGEYKLLTDARPNDSITPVNLELFLDPRDGSDIVMNNTRNELQIKFQPWGTDPMTFGKKPICLYRVHDKSLELLADIREAIAKSPDGITRIPLPNLNGIYHSQEPYAKFQVRFNFPGDIDLVDRRVNAKDLEIMSNEWLAEGDPNDPNSLPMSDISGPNDVPDRIVNLKDFTRLARDWHKDANDPNTW